MSSTVFPIFIITSVKPPKPKVHEVIISKNLHESHHYFRDIWDMAQIWMVNDATMPFLCRPGSVWGNFEPRNPSSEESWVLDALCGSRIVGQTGPALFPRPNDGDLIILIIDQGPAWANMTRLTKYWPNIDHMKAETKELEQTKAVTCLLISVMPWHATWALVISHRNSMTAWQRPMSYQRAGQRSTWTLLRLLSSSQPRHQAWP